LQALAKVDDYVKALGGEALCLLIEDCAHPPKPLMRAYETFLLAGTLLAPHDVILELAARLKSKTLQLLGERNRLLENRLSRAQGRQPSPRARNQVQIPFFMIKQSNDMISLIDGHDQRL